MTRVGLKHQRKKKKIYLGSTFEDPENFFPIDREENEKEFKIAGKLHCICLFIYLWSV
jgi:hypothetical protein